MNKEPLYLRWNHGIFTGGLVDLEKSTSILHKSFFL